MPEPTNTPSAPSCIIIAASAGVAMPPAVNSTTGSLPARATSLTSSYGARSSFAAANSSSSPSVAEPADLGADLAHVPGRLDDVAGAGLALGADHRGALGEPAQRLAEVGRAADERHGERPLVDVVGLVGRRQHLGLVDVVDADGLQHLGLDEVPDPGLGHDGIETALTIPSIMSGSLIRATPPCARMSAGTRSSAITATAPASSAILACSGVTTSMITPPLSISAMPRLTLAVPVRGPVALAAASELAAGGADPGAADPGVAGTEVDGRWVGCESVTGTSTGKTGEISPIVGA